MTLLGGVPHKEAYLLPKDNLIFVQVFMDGDLMDGGDGGGPGQSSEYRSEVTLASINQLEDSYSTNKAALLAELLDDDDAMSVKSGTSERFGGGGSGGASFAAAAAAGSTASSTAAASAVVVTTSCGSGRTRDKFLSSNVHDMLVSGYASTQDSPYYLSPASSPPRGGGDHPSSRPAQPFLFNVSAPPEGSYCCMLS